MRVLEGKGPGTDVAGIDVSIARTIWVLPIYLLGRSPEYITPETNV